MSASSIQAWGDGLSHGCAGQQANFLVNPNGLNMSGVTFGVEGPSRPEFIFNHPPGGAVEVGYIPTFPGLYKIHIKFFGRDIPGSPFPVEIIGDSQSKVEMVRDVIQNVKISGPAATNGRPLITNQFLLDAREAIVTGGLNAFMQGPGNVEVGFKENLDGTIHVQYKPSHSGVYKLNIKFGDIPVVGSPFIINVN
ncbi:Filamin-A [Pseudolycoriella hygida]|uniref:Filamin-A n=1 Tax=Pseudolycoriella hygida TaxID=35572 RepID=A0A9Q0S6X3_9DIPT|nr:Filamin-A [Pseudolycoriella hygida]